MCTNIRERGKSSVNIKDRVILYVWVTPLTLELQQEVLGVVSTCFHLHFDCVTVGEVDMLELVPTSADYSVT